MSTKTIIEIENFNFSYGDNLVLEDINFDVKKGEIIGLLGENGSGKTTLLNSIYGINGYTENIKVFSEYPELDNKVIKNKVSYIQDTPQLLDYLTAKQYLSFICNIENIAYEGLKDNIMNLINVFNLENDYTNKLIKDYSFGMKKKIQIIGDLILHRDIVIIDEPTNGLDIRMIILIKDLIHKENQLNKTTFIISSHNTKFLKDVCNKVLLFNNKKIERIIEIDLEMDLDFEFIKSVDNYEK